MFLIVGTLNSPLATNVPDTQLTQQGRQEEERVAPGDGMNDFSPKCELQGSTHVPAFSMNGDYLIGGVFSIHFYTEEVNREYTTTPDPSRCTGRSVKKKEPDKVCFHVI